MDEDELKKDDDGELKGEVLLPEADDDLLGEDEEDLLLPKHVKKEHGVDEESDVESLDALADEELEEDEPYDDVDNW